VTRSDYRRKAGGAVLAIVKRASKITHLLPGTRVVFVDHVAGTTTLLCPGCGAKLIHRGGRIDLGDDRRTA
jgi:hypothetical protein